MYCSVLLYTSERARVRYLFLWRGVVFELPGLKKWTREVSRSQGFFLSFLRKLRFLIMFVYSGNHSYIKQTANETTLGYIYFSFWVGTEGITRFSEFLIFPSPRKCFFLGELFQHGGAYLLGPLESPPPPLPGPRYTRAQALTRLLQRYPHRSQTSHNVAYGPHPHDETKTNNAPRRAN